MYGLDLFTGIGGMSLALAKYVKPIAYCEIEPYCQSVLLQRMPEGYLPKAPIWDDIRTLSGNELPEIDIIYGGFPCTDISIAGRRRGLEGKRSGLIFEVFRLLYETKAPFIFLENVPNIRTKGAERVCKELAERGYDSRWCCLSAGDMGAKHKRERWFLLGYSNSTRNIGLPIGKKETHSKLGKHVEYYEWKPWNEDRPKLLGVVNVLSHRMDRIKALGNAVVPMQARKAFNLLMGRKC